MKKKYMNWLAVIIWMIIIFIFSAQPGEVSNENNKFIIKLFNMIGLNLNGVFGTLADFLVRKVAHLTEYFILFILVYNAVNHGNTKQNKKYLRAIVIVFLYACSDELHQVFVPGRGPAFRDVMIDTSGGMLALSIIWFKNKFKLIK